MEMTTDKLSDKLSDKYECTLGGTVQSCTTAVQWLDSFIVPTICYELATRKYLTLKRKGEKWAKMVYIFVLGRQAVCTNRNNCLDICTFYQLQPKTCQVQSAEYGTGFQRERYKHNSKWSCSQYLPLLFFFSSKQFQRQWDWVNLLYPSSLTYLNQDFEGTHRRAKYTYNTHTEIKSIQNKKRKSLTKI